MLTSDVGEEIKDKGNPPEDGANWTAEQQTPDLIKE